MHISEIKKNTKFYNKYERHCTNGFGKFMNNNNNNLYDTFYLKFLADESKNFHNFHLTQHIMLNQFNIEKALEIAPDLLRSEITFMTNCCKLSQEEFANLRINLLRNLNI